MTPRPGERSATSERPGTTATSRTGRRVLAVAVLTGLAAGVGCKRDADRPLPPSSLFPDAKAEKVAPTATAPLERLAVIEAIEGGPSGGRADVTTVAAGAVVHGALERDDDTDWIHVAPGAAAGSLLRVELREAPSCAVLRRFDALEGEVLATARPWRDERPTLTSLRDTEAGVWLQIGCEHRARRPTAAAAGADKGDGEASSRRGPWRLAITSRVPRPDEEREPNDRAGPWTRLLGVGAVVQATFAPLGDVDTFRLDLSNALPGDALLLSVTGVPGLRTELELRRDDRDEPLLTRRSAVGEGVLVPNLDVRRTGERPLLILRAQVGARVDDAYAATIRPLLPAGCRTQGSCPERIPIEREPNDARADAMGIRPGGTITGLLDATEDVDWYAVDGEVDDVLGVALSPPPGVALRLQVVQGGEIWFDERAPAADAQLSFAGRRVRARRVHIGVSSAEGYSRTAPYTLRATLRQEPSFEREGDDVAPTPLTSSPLVRSGALAPAGDIDIVPFEVVATAGFGRHVTASCRGDGVPMLRCRLQRADGVELARWTVEQADGAVACEPVVLAPGRYALVVDREAATASVTPYTASVNVDDVAVPLAAAPTPAAAPNPAATQAAAPIPAAPNPTAIHPTATHPEAPRAAAPATAPPTRPPAPE